MAMKLAQFKEWMNSPERKERDRKANTSCVGCKEQPGFYKTPYGMLCEDCCFEKLGDEIEKHPIGRYSIFR